MPILAPASNDADYLQGIVEASALEAVVCRRPEQLAEAIAAGHLFVVLTREGLTPAVAELLLAAWKAEPDWSHPALVALLDGGQRLPVGLRSVLREMPWVATAVVHRPWRRRELISVFRRQAEFRARQFRVAAAIGASEQAVQRQQAARNALEHAAKNLLANLQSMVRLAVREGGHGDELAESLGHRLYVMTRVHELLAREVDRVSLRDVVRETLRTHPGAGDRVRIDGPDQPLTPRAATSLALALHELADNAVRHGALRAEAGDVSLGWSVADQAGDRRFHLVWTEEGRVPIAEPGPKGFGRRMLEEVLPRGLRGTTVLAFKPGGLRFTLDAPLRQLTPPPG